MAIKFNRATLLVATTSLILGFSANVFAGEYAGTWILDDTSGNPFKAILAEDGKASGTHGDAMKYGSWKEEDGTAVIHWTTGWTTIIAKQGDKFVKSAFKPGASLTGTPTNTSGATKKE